MSSRHSEDAADSAELVHAGLRPDGIDGVDVVYEIGQSRQPVRARLRPENPLDTETFDRYDAWTLYALQAVEETNEGYEATHEFEISHVPPVVSEAMWWEIDEDLRGVVQVTR